MAREYTNNWGTLEKRRERFIRNARKSHGDRYSYDHVKYVDIKTKVLITCRIHGDFSTTPHAHLTAIRSECKQCYELSRKRVTIEKSAKKHTLTKDIFVERSIAKHGDRYDYSQVEYNGCYEPVTIICKKHGPFDKVPYFHYLKGLGCPQCRLHPIKKWTDEEVVFLKSNYTQLGCAYCASQLKTSQEVVRSKAGKLGLSKRKIVCRAYRDIPYTFWTTMVRNAKCRNLDVGITIEDIWSMFIGQEKRCALTNWDICFGRKEKTTASVDRIDSSKGYVRGNVQLVHKHVNRAKVNYEEGYFYSMCEAIVAHRKDLGRLHRNEDLQK